MNSNLLPFLEAFPCMRVLVIGEAILDSYLTGSTDRLCREAPVPVVSLNGKQHAPGGASNTAVNVSSLGAETIFLSVVGDDHEGELLHQALEEQGVSTTNLLVQPGRNTLAKNRVVAGSQMVVRFDQGSVKPVSPEIESAMIERLIDLFPTCDAVIISDYNYGILTPRVIQAIAELQANDPRVIVGDSKNLPALKQVGVTAVKPNYQEAVQLIGLSQLENLAERARQIAKHGDQILDLTGAQIAAVTLDTDGALIFERGAQPYRTYAKPAPHSRAAGAGDTFVSALALALGAGAYTAGAAELASAASSIVVSKKGTANCSVTELRNHFGGYEKQATDVFALTARVSSYHQAGKRIVFTNGCFDILHRGHITYLNQAKALGDVLVLGINSDNSVRRLKGPARPINPLEDRMQVLSALSCIDLIVPFDGDTPSDLIKVIKPDVFVKGGDYTRESLPEAQLVESLGGEVVLLPYLDDRSTSSIIERIRLAYTWQAEDRAKKIEGSSNAG
jgi:D-beta-D-heptose 7-phosphate kinase/D-beta-D-heptose 1-phosphate adenosyltransferase